MVDFSQVRVAVMGDVMLDVYWSGSTDRISPEAPVPVVKLAQSSERLGGAANVANNLASLGIQTDLVGLIGDDNQGQRLRGLLAQQPQIKQHLSVVNDCPTITKTRIIAQNQQLLRLDQEANFSHHTTNIISTAKQVMGENSVIILSDYGKGTLDSMSQLIEHARDEQIPVIIDPKGQDFSRYTGATLLTPNLKEFQLIVGPCGNNAELQDRGMQLIDDLELDALLITQGAAGMTLLQAGQIPQHFPAQAHEVFDVTGAGDTVIAVLSAVVAAGGDFVTAARLANHAAGIVVGRLGTVTITAESLVDVVIE